MLKPYYNNNICSYLYKYLLKYITCLSLKLILPLSVKIINIWIIYKIISISLTDIYHSCNFHLKATIFVVMSIFQGLALSVSSIFLPM